MAFDDSIIVRDRRESLLGTHQVLRNTYLLLSLTLLWSAGLALYSLQTNAPMMGGIGYCIVAFGLLFLTQFLRNSVWGLLSIFAFTGFMGYTLGPILNFYLHAYTNGSQLIMQSLGGTGLTFFGLSAYVLTTRKDMSFLTGFIVTGSIVLILAIVASIFFHSTALNLAISAGMILFCSMSILWRTSAIIHGGETNYISATITLYLDILNLFLSILRILSFVSGRRD